MEIYRSYASRDIKGKPIDRQVPYVILRQLRTLDRVHIGRVDGQKYQDNQRWSLPKHLLTPWVEGDLGISPYLSVVHTRIFVSSEITINYETAESKHNPVDIRIKDIKSLGVRVGRHPRINIEAWLNTPAGLAWFGRYAQRHQIDWPPQPYEKENAHDQQAYTHDRQTVQI